MADRDAEVAFKLFEFIAAKDHASVDDKESILATFKECLEAVRGQASGHMTLIMNTGEDPAAK
jgi:hypothetical protein